MQEYFHQRSIFFHWRKVNLLDKRSRMVRNHAFVMMKVKRLRQCLICGFLHLRLVFFSWPQKRKNVFPCSTDLSHQKTGAVWKQGATPTKSSLILKPFIITPCKQRRLRTAKRASKPESWFPLCRDHWMTIPKFWPKVIPRLFFRYQIFRNRDFFAETKFSKTKTGTFFPRPNSPKPVLFFWDQILGNPNRNFFGDQILWIRNPPKIGKSLETETETKTSQYPWQFFERSSPKILPLFLLLQKKDTFLLRLFSSFFSPPEYNVNVNVAVFAFLLLIELEFK